MGESDLSSVHRRTSWKATDGEGEAEVDLELGTVGSSDALHNIKTIPLSDPTSSGTQPPANSSSIRGGSGAGPSGAVPESDQTPTDLENKIQVWTKDSKFWASNCDSFFNDSHTVSGYLTRHPKTSQNTSSHTIDFIAFITLLSRIYSRGRYIDMQSLDPNNDGSDIGTGAVYRVTLIQVTLDRPSEITQDEVVTVKQNTILKSTQRPINWRNADDSEIKSFMKELQIMSHDPLYRHPNVVTLRGVGWYYHVHDFSTPQIRTWAEPRLLLEQAETTLEEFLSSNPDLPFQARLRILHDVSCGLLQIHECSVIHGDVKPDNVLLFRNTDSNEDNSHQFNFTAKIADFSHSIIDTGSLTSLPGGTYGYIAPEALEGNINPEYAKATDVFSLGMLFWRVLFPDVELPIRRPYGVQCEDLYYSKAKLQVYQSFQNSTDREWKHNLLEFLFQNTLRIDPKNRSLESVTKRLRGVDRDGMTMLIPITVEKSPLVDEYITDKICISYQNFRAVSGVVKDQIVDALQTIAENETDPRRPRALYELAICSLTNFGYPSTSLKRFTWPPAESGLPTHLDYLVKAAELGERAAKAVVKRIFQTEPTFDSPPQTIEWLRDAAANGYVIALEDLAEGNYDLYRLAIMSKVERMYDKELSMDPSETFSQRVTAYLEKDSNDFIERDINSRGDTFLHWAVACGHVGWVRTFITEYNMDINLRNHDGDTPLLLGCKNDQYETVKCLLSFSSCDVHSRTKLGESALHFAWCFAKKDEAAAVVRELASRGIDFQLPAEEAAGHGESRVIAPRVTHLDPLPVLPGLAIERVVARNRTDLFRLFLELGAKVTPCNGALTRRMLLWATRLGHHEMLHLIYEFAQRGRAGTQDPSLRPLADTSWEFEGTTLKLEHSLALGWVSGSGDGWDTPVEYWRKCCKGGKYLAALCSIIGNKTEFQQCDAALDWAFRRGHTDFVSALLECRFEDLCRIELPSWKCARQKYILWRDLISIENPKAPIDEICYSSDGTLAQRAILKGDRGMFNLLVRGHGADMRSICFFPGDKGGTWGSAYYLILKAHHFDIWFAHQLHELQIPGVDYGAQCYDTFNTSLPLVKDDDSDLFKYRHVAPSAINRRFYELAQFLQANDLSEHVKDILHPDFLQIDTIDFVFQPQSPKLPDQFTRCGGYYIFELLYKHSSIIKKDGSQGSPQVLKAKVERVWLELLARYPGFVDPPRSGFGARSVLAMSHWISDFAMHRTLDTLEARRDRSWLPSRFCLNIVGYTELDLPAETSKIYQRLYALGYRHSIWRSPAVWLIAHGTLIWIHVFIVQTILQLVPFVSGLIKRGPPEFVWRLARQMGLAGLMTQGLDLWGNMFHMMASPLYMALICCMSWLIFFGVGVYFDFVPWGPCIFSYGYSLDRRRVMPWYWSKKSNYVKFRRFWKRSLRYYDDE